MVALAGRQFGVVSRAQLCALGATRDDLRGAVRRGALLPLWPGVYAVGHRNLVPHGRLLAAQLSCGDGAFLSHRTSAGVRRLRALNLHRIELTVPGRRLAARERLIIHQSAPPDPSEVRRHGPLLISSVPRLLVELAVTETAAELDRLITEAVRHHRLDLADLERTLARHARRPGISALREALRTYRPHPDRASSLERAFDALLAGDPEIPPPLRNVIVHGWEADCYWPQFGLVVELDGRDYHAARRDMERDRFRDGELLKHGIGTLRVTDLRLELESERVRADVRALTVGRSEGPTGR